MKTSAFFSIPAKVFGTSPLELATPIVEDDEFALFGKAVQDRRIPVVQVSGEMLVEDQRNAAGLAKSAVGKANNLGLDKRCRGSDGADAVYV
jgi:hypothetical protein